MVIIFILIQGFKLHRGVLSQNLPDNAFKTCTCQAGSQLRLQSLRGSGGGRCPRPRGSTPVAGATWLLMELSTKPARSCGHAQSKAKGMKEADNLESVKEEWVCETESDNQPLSDNPQITNTWLLFEAALKAGAKCLSPTEQK